jgi:hypothetical protein
VSLLGHDHRSLQGVGGGGPDDVEQGHESLPSPLETEAEFGFKRSLPHPEPDAVGWWGSGYRRS